MRSPTSWTPTFPSLLSRPLSHSALPPRSRPCTSLCLFTPFPQQMELLLVNKLKWNLAAMTPHDFIEHFLSKMPVAEENKQIIRKHAQTFVALCATGRARGPAGPASPGAPGRAACPLPQFPHPSQWPPELSLPVLMSRGPGLLAGLMEEGAVLLGVHRLACQVHFRGFCSPPPPQAFPLSSRSLRFGAPCWPLPGWATCQGRLQGRGARGGERRPAAPAPRAQAASFSLSPPAGAATRAAQLPEAPPGAPL